MKRMNRPRPLASAGVLIALGLAVAMFATGCNYFRPTRPETPLSDVIVPRYTQPDTTLYTLLLALQDKSATNGQSAYIGGFADPENDGAAFVAEFDPLTVARFPGQPTDWDIGKEEIFYGNLSRLLPTSAFLMAWGDFRGAPSDDFQATTAILYRSYLLQATPDDGATYVPVARGNAEIHFALLRGSWKIVRWIDSEDPQADLNLGELCFGQLRLAGP